VLAHEIASAEPAVALLEYVMQNLAIGLDGVGVTFEALARLRRILDDLADDLAGFADVALDAESACVADRLLVLMVEAHDLGREARGHPPRQAADRALLALEVEQRDVAFGRGVELDDVRNPKALFELRPDVGPQAVAAGEPQPVRALLRVRRGVEKVTAE